MNSVATHQVPSSAAQTADASKDFDISELMTLLDKDGSTIQRESRENNALLGAKEASNDHDHHTSKRRDRLVQSFINGLKNFGRTDVRKVYTDLLKPVGMKEMAKTKEVLYANRSRRIKAADFTN